MKYLGVIIGFCLGCGPITFTIVPELLDQFTRPAAMTLAVLSLWSSFAIVGFVTPFLFVSALPIRSVGFMW